MSRPRTLALIPARGGSKRLPRKNVRPFLGRPVLTYAIEAARMAGCFDEVMVSTDDAEVAGIARAAGAAVPFPRSARTSDDHATLADVVIEVLATYAARGERFDLCCCLLPTAPFVTAERLREGLARLEASSVDAVFPVVRFSYPIQRALRMDGERVAMMWPEHAATRSQDLEPAYHDAGQFYWLRTEAVIAERRVFCARSAPIVLDELEVQDIDTETDWKLAELKFRLRNEERLR